MEGETKICPLCGMEVDSKAEECAFCGADLRDVVIEKVQEVTSVDNEEVSATPETVENECTEPELLEVVSEKTVENLEEPETVVPDVLPVTEEEIEEEGLPLEAETFEAVASVEEDRVEVVEPNAARPVRYKHIPDYVPKEYSQDDPSLGTDLITPVGVRGSTVNNNDNKHLFWLILAIVLLVCLCGCCFIGILALKFFGG